MARLEAELAEKLAITAEGIARQLDEDRAMALENKQGGAAVSASMGKARLAGLLIDKHDVGVAVTIDRIERVIIDPGDVIEHDGPVVKFRPRKRG